jgi:hypothetical protein
MEHRIQPASRDESHLLMLCMQSQFQHTVGSIAHQLDRAVGKPTPDQADHLLRPHRHRFVPLAQPFTDLRGGCQHTQKARPSVASSKAR